MCPLSLSAAHVSVHHISSCCVSLALNLREFCSFFSLRYLRYLCPCLRIAHRWSVLSLWYLCDISVLSMLSCARAGVCFVLSLCYICALGAIYMRPCAGDCSVHKLGLSNCIAVWPLRMHRQKPKTHVLLERRARQAPKQVFLLILHAHAAPQKRSRKLKFHFSKKSLDFPLTWCKNHTVLTRFYLFLITFACVYV